MALFRRFFYRKPPEGLLEISESVYVFDCCFSTDVLEEDDYKVYMGGIVSQLRDHFPDASFMVFNFRDGERQSQISNILSEYDMTVMDYPRHYEGCPLLTMEMIHHFLRSSESWLSLGQQNLLLMHCERGGWPVLAFMLAALLIYRKQYTGEQKTLDMIYKQAPRELLQLLSPLNPLPSQMRYLQYVSRRNVGSEWPPLDRALTLDCVILRILPNFDGEGGCRPIFRIYGQDPFIAADRTPKVLFSMPKKSKSVRLYRQEDCELVKIDIHCHIQGDVVLECISLDEDLEREEMMFRVMFNTAFIRSNILMLNRDDIDILWNAKDRFPKEFRAEVLLSEMDVSASLIPMDLVCGEEKEGLPVEAFAKVQEIFSTVDWLDDKGEAALQILQHMSMSSGALEKLDTGFQQKAESTGLPLQSSPVNLEENSKVDESNNTTKTLLSTEKQHPQQHLKVAKDSSKHNVQPHELQAAFQRASQPKIISQRIPRTSLSNPVSYSNSLQGSPAPISRYHSAPSLLGITALLHDHAAEVTHSVATSMSPLSLSTTTEPLLAEPTATQIFESPSPLSTSLPKLSSSVDPNLKAPPPSPPPPPPPPPPSRPELSPSQLPSLPSTILKAAASPPPPPPPPLPRKSHLTLSSSSTHQQSTGKDRIPTSPLPSAVGNLKPGRDQPTSSPPAPPPPPPPSGRTLNKAPMPPPPPPLTSTALSGSHPPRLPPEKNSGIIASPPPPPPPPLRPGAGPPTTKTSAPPPPPPPRLMPKSSVGIASQNSTPAPPAPPPPTLKRLGSPQLSSAGSKGSGNVPGPPPPVDGLNGLKGRLTRTSSPRNTLSTQSKRTSLKPLHWVKVTRAMQGSLWADAQKNDEASKAPEFDMSELECLFSAAVPNSDRASTGERANRRASLGPNKIHLIDLRRANNCEIMLTKVKMPLPDLMSSLLALDDSVLDADQVDNLIKFCPTKEEMDLLKGHDGDRDSLGKCEQFFLELMKVPRVESKLRVFSFKIQFCSQVSDLRRNLNIVNSAAEEVRNSAKLKRIMQTILSLGNALNQGTARGSAIGFRLDSLLKLTDTRARNNKMTLMHYLCKVLAEKLPELLDFHKNLVSLEAATKIQLKTLAEEMQAISKGLEKVEQELTASENDGPVSETFRKTLKEFLVVAESDVRSLTSLYSGVGRNADALALYFGEDPARCPFEQVVSTLLNFVKMFGRAHEENCKQLELEKKKAQKEAENEKLKMNNTKREPEHVTRSPSRSRNVK
ncbi:Formin-like protein 6 [Acorus calamus]|uniref:Formin-like protein n=1 Tax=Acorus calamus TaxID=4465 RepID=A0AAV9CXR7_ACOCL|nr:Formin-like protein 6 [Acorus calamus]